MYRNRSEETNKRETVNERDILFNDSQYPLMVMQDYLPSLTRLRSSKVSDFGRGLCDLFDERVLDEFCVKRISFSAGLVVFTPWEFKDVKERFRWRFTAFDVKSDKRARNEPCNCVTRPVIFDICRSIALRGAVRNEWRERIVWGVLLLLVSILSLLLFVCVFVISFDEVWLGVRNEYGRGLLAIKGTVGRSWDVNEVDDCKRTDDGPEGGVRLAYT